MHGRCIQLWAVVFGAVLVVLVDVLSLFGVLDVLVVVAHFQIVCVVRGLFYGCVLQMSLRECIAGVVWHYRTFAE